METTTEILKSKIQGKLILPDDENYNEARKIYNGMIDKYPAMILQCKTTSEVKEGINFARENEMEVSVRSGGHSGAGLALVDDGLVINLSLMKDIHIDPETKTAIIQPGNTLKEIDRATHVFGLALPGGIVGTTGIGGLTLGGGIGYLSRKAGLTIDHLIEAELILANGELIKANKNNYPDLFWAIRGGGGNFGVVVSFTFQLIDLKTVYAGPMFWPMEKAGEAMKFYDNIMKNSSKDLYGFFAFLMVPPAPPFPEHLHNQRVCGVVWNFTGPIETAEKVFEPIRAFGPPILDFVGEIPLPALNSMFDELYPSGMNWYWKAHYLQEFSDGCIDQSIKHGALIPNMHSTTHYYPIDGEVQAVSNSETAWANRDARWAHVIVGVHPDSQEAGTVTNWCKNYYNDMLPYSMNGGAYVNFMMEEGQDRIKAAYGKNYKRLVEIKLKYDPNNFFHINQNINPAVPETT